jgi:hypothetical protein
MQAVKVFVTEALLEFHVQPRSFEALARFVCCNTVTGPSKHRALLLWEEGKSPNQQVCGGDVANPPKASDAPRFVIQRSAKPSGRRSVFEHHGGPPPRLDLLLEAWCVVLGTSAAGGDDKVGMWEPLLGPLFQPAAGKAAIEPVGRANACPCVAQVMHVEDGGRSLFSQGPSQWKRVGVMAHHHVRFGTMACFEGASTETTQPAERGKTRSVGLDSEVMPNDANVADLFLRRMILPPVEGVNGDGMACIRKPARLSQDPRVGGAGVGDEHHHMTHEGPPRVEVMRIRRAVSE